ncbi:hypothetical protein AVEN_186307-1 [Araneus ventricosus]|uniref:Uncharacterized protein n=1 Tax=Araneus ventricosus TaxID=182803 RepID=A0A4Y2CQT7_ARAVE|nr:hypothetical protein AVEN_186307-1 [Araneus ventricosus]
MIQTVAVWCNHIKTNVCVTPYAFHSLTTLTTNHRFAHTYFPSEIIKYGTHTRLFFWSSKSPDAQLLTHFFGKLEVFQMRMCFDGRLRPDKVKNEFENVPIPDGLLNFLKKYGEIREDTNELVVDADRITFTDYCHLPSKF